LSTGNAGEAREKIFLGQGAARLSWSRENIASMIPRPEIVLYSRESSSRPNSSKI
jgi:hypothetical protein